MANAPGYRRQTPGEEVPQLSPEYKSTVPRSPAEPMVMLPHSLSEITGPLAGHEALKPGDDDLTHYEGGEAMGQRIIVTGRVSDADGNPVRDCLLDVWQCNAAGRYRHEVDQHDAPLDPHFGGGGRCVTDGNGEYRFITIEPGSYPWGNHENAWRPKHIHFSLYGTGLATRLITQMYFPGDPLIPLDPIYNSVPDETARQRLIAEFDLQRTKPEWALAYRWDIVLRGRMATPMEEGNGKHGH